MKKRQLLCVVLGLMIPLTAFSQKLTVEKMQLDVNDLSASSYERKDLNNDPCALVKVQLAAFGAKFEGFVIGNVEYKTGEYWVYMKEGSRELRIKHPNYLPLHVNFSDYGIERGVKGKQTYSLTLVIPQLMGLEVDDGMRYLVMSVEPANATVYIDDLPQVVQNGTLSMLLPMGEHRYKVESPAYETKSGTFTIGNEKLSLPVKLQSNMATLNISSTTQGTQIYVNDQLRGTSSWSGLLPAGTYRIEGRLQGHRNYRQNITLLQRGNQQITIPALQAITGNLNVNYQPADAEVWIDDKKVGTSPDVFRNLIIGSHQLEVRKNGYEPQRQTITIIEGKTHAVSGTLTAKSVPSQVSDKVVAYNTNTSSNNDQVHDVVEKMPMFKGGPYNYHDYASGEDKVIFIESGPSGLFRYLSLAIKYPVVAKEYDVQGRVVCTFVVERDGSITDVKVVKSVDDSLDKEAVRVLRSMPKWEPGAQNGTPVRVQYTVPVTFSLQ